MEPSCIASFATNKCKSEIKLLLHSLAAFMPNSQVVLFVDDEIKDMIQNFDTKVTSALNLQNQIVVNLNKYSNKTRDQMESDGTWTDFQMVKSQLIDYCLTLYPDVLYLDSDICLLNRIYIPTECDLVLSPHYIQKSVTDQYGYYNGGVLWTNQPTMGQCWRDYTKTSRYFDQASLEECAKHFKTKVFDQNHNIAYWRTDNSDEPREQMKRYLSVTEENLYFKGKPIIFIHTHFNNSAAVTNHHVLYTDFNHTIIKLLLNCNQKRHLLRYIQSLECVVARYNETIDWMVGMGADDVGIVSLFNRILIYNKGEMFTDKGNSKSKSKDKEVEQLSLPNIGREAHTYLHHIIHNYDNLADITVFTQARIDDHGYKHDSHSFDQLILDCYTYGYSRNFIELDYINKDTWVGPNFNVMPQWQQDLNINYHVPLDQIKKTTFLDWFVEHIDPQFPANHMRIYKNAIFAVTKDRILAHAKDYYLKIYNSIAPINAPIESHFLERSWYYMFTHAP